jgi:hypothetical protein
MVVDNEPVQADLSARGSGSRNLENTSSHTQTGVRGHHFHRRYPLSCITSFTSSDITLLRFLVVDGGNHKTSFIGQCFRCSKMSLEVAISLEDIEFFGRFVFVIASKGPGTSICRGVSRRKVQRSQSNTEVEVTENELDGRQPSHKSARNISRRQ